MKKIIAWLLVLALTAAISIGATLAYLTDTDEDVNVMTLGKVKIDQLEYERVDVESKDDNATVQEFHDNKPLLPAVTDKNFDYTPGDTYVDWDQIGKEKYTSPIWDPSKINNEVDKMVFIKNKGDYDAFVRTVFAFEAGNYTTLDQFKSMMHLNLNNSDFTWAWVETPVTIGASTYFVATATYNKVLAPGALTEISLSQIALDKTATNEDVEAFGDTYQILVKTQAIQADGFEDPVFALEEGFGEITATNIPWDSDAPTKGIDLKNALHYLDGDTTTSAISKKITSVTFGLNKNYAEIVGTYEGTLVDVEQDVPVFVYYVPNGSNYDVYALADDVIYAPKDSSNLFKEMQIMATLDTSNLDFGRAELMNSLLYNCFALETLDVTGWDVSNATTFDRLFYTCKKLETITGLGTWDISNVESLFGTFYCCYELSSVGGVENWDTSSVTTMAHAFRCAYDIEELDLNSWDVSNVKEFNSMFSGTTNGNDMALHTLKINQWNTKSAERFNNMFQGCGHLISLDMAGWNVEKLLTTSHMFADCNRLASVDFTGWNTVSLTSMDAMFNDCHAIEVLDVSEFDTANCVEFSQIFEGCRSLERIIGLDQWNTAKANVFDEMFNGASSLKELDLSSFDTSSAKYSNVLQNGEKNYHGYGNMFNGTSSLQKLILGEKFVFAGDGSIPAANYPKFPNPAAKEGLTAMWRNVATGERYLAKDIPEGVAATYVADYEYTAKGAKLVDALHYLNANTGSTKITTKVTSVTFGRTDDYADIANTYTGVLADWEQDGPVYAYYVPNDSNYDVYFLSDSKIYTPKNSTSLFEGMTALKAVDTENLDVSRTENMNKMFYGCSKLSTLDASDWDTGNVTDLGYAFHNCESLQTLDTSNWNTAKLTNLGWTFFQCKNLKTIDTSNWDTSSSTSLLATFNGCEKLETLDVSKWDTSSLTDPGAAFQNCKALKTLDVSKWDVSKVTRTTQMFNGCVSLESLPVTNWNFENLQQTTTMFQNCKALKTLDVSKWNMSTVFRIEGMFNHCETIEFLDVSNWDVSGMSNMGTAFQQCWALKTLDVSKWNTSNVTTMGWMFYGCRNLEVIDISKWDVSKVTVMSHMFADCNKVKELKVDNWDLSSLQSLDATFNDCDSLTTINVSKWNTGNVREFSQTFDGCDNLAQIIGLENWNTTNGKVFDEMFNACKSLKVLNLSSFDTRNVTPGFKNVNGDRCKGFSSTFAGMKSVEKIILGPNFRFAGNGQVTEQYQPKFPNPVSIDGQAAKWYNAANDTYYTAAEIPEPNGETVTYVAAIPPVNP